MEGDAGYKYLKKRENPYYYTFAQFCRDNFGRKLYRVPLDIGCSCPNRDGKAGMGGCIFCSSEGSGEFAIQYTGQKLKPEELHIKHSHYDVLRKTDTEQLSKSKRLKGNNPSVRQEIPKKRCGSYIAYFQSFTNTYASAQRLEPLFRAALEDDTFAGISIATRPDCMGEDIMRMLCAIKKDFPGKFIWIELGLQTMHEGTAKLINRGYRLEVFEDCVKKLKENGFPVIVHVIIGLPGESQEDIFETVKYLDKLGIDGIKLQLLHILKGTKLYEMYLQEPEKIKVLTQEEYTDIVCGCLQRLSSDIVVHRLTGDGQRDKLVAPLWSLDKKKVLNGIMKEMKRLKYEEVFDKYADVDEGFTKTSIKIKNMFDSFPVSRSQARRLVNGLERFEVVELDFTGVEDMGQGFGDEVFRIFATLHPEVKLELINMNGDVEKMYKHVSRR